MPLESITYMVAAFCPLRNFCFRFQLRQMRRGRRQWTGCSGRACGMFLAPLTVERR